jgi:hypothetical protein
MTLTGPPPPLVISNKVACLNLGTWVGGMYASDDEDGCGDEDGSG